MLRALSNLIFRDRDPTRAWHADPGQLIVDVRRCTLCSVPLGGAFEGLSALGRSEDARQAARGLLDFSSRGLHCTLEGGRLSDFTLEFIASGRTQPFPGIVQNDGATLPISHQTTEDQLVRLLGEPFCRAADEETIVFYEYSVGEVQFTFSRYLATLEAIELWYEPELSWPGELERLGVEQPFPDQLRRRLAG